MKFFEGFSKKPKSELEEERISDEQVDQSKRNFLVGVGATAVATAVPKTAEAMLMEEAVEPTDSALFHEDVKTVSWKYESDMPFVLDKGRQRDEELGGMTKAEYLASHLQFDFEDEAPILASELKRLIVGLAIVESRFDSSRVSKDKAEGDLQFIPSTWAEHAEEGMDPRSIKDQVVVANKLFNQTYRYLTQQCQAEFLQIQTNFFSESESGTGKFNEDFQEMFLTPVMLNAHNCGMGTIKKVVKWFVGEYPTPESTIDALEVDHPHTGYDAFRVMSLNADYEESVKYYRSDASTYVFNVYAATLALHNYLTPDDMYFLLGSQSKIAIVNDSPHAVVVGDGLS